MHKIKYVIKNDKLPEDKINLPMTFNLSKDEADDKNQKLAKVNAPGRFIKLNDKKKINHR